VALASWRPALWVSVAFNANPNDPSIVPNWSDLSSPYFVAADTIQRGRQYELDVNQASQPTFSFLDQSEYLNPANTSSPFYPLVVPLRQILMQAMWPNQATGNLMNTNQGASSILGTTTAGYDPSFESYTAGAAVPWITAVGGVTPTVGTSNPHTGSKDLTYTVSTAATEQGVTWTVPAVPGQQYTASAYVRQSSASSQTLTVGGLTAGIDAFNRTSSSGWGTADVGGSWTNTGGAAGDYSTLPGDLGQGTAHISMGSVNVGRMTTLAASGVDCDVTAYVSVPAVATGAAIRMGVVGRWTNSSNFYRASADFNTDSSVTFTIWKRVAGVETSLTSTTMSFMYATDTQYGLRLKVQGTNLSASMWQRAGTEPVAFTLTTTDSALTGAGQPGCWSRLQTGNTNSTPVLSYYAFGATYTASGTSTSTTGSYVRLTATYTATAPTHTIGVLTLTGATAGTVLVDDVQVEQGAAANTFDTTGPTIYGVFRGFVERWPSQWQNGGFLGACQATAVDAFEALNLYSLNADYFQQVLDLQPVFYWPLHDAAGSTTYGESSGNNGPPLVNYPSKYGPGTAPAAGTSLNIVGDVGGTGVAFDSQETDTTTGAGTIIGIGQLVQGAGTTFPWPVIGSTWSASIVCWFACEVPKFGASDDMLLTWSPLPGTVASSDLTPFSIDLDSGGQFQVFYGGATSLNELFGAGPVLTDGLPHLAVATMSQVSGGNTTVTAYIDGTQINTVTVTTASLGGVFAIQPQTFMAGGFFSQGTYTQILNGSMGHIALWNRVLSAAEVTDLWTAGGLGNAGETSGARIARYIAPTWHGLTSIDTGNAIMGASSVSDGTPVLQACQDVTVSEQGNFYADKDGQIVFVERDTRYLDLTSLWTFGDGAGELHYLDDLAYDYDPTFVFNRVEVDNADGVIAVVTNPTSQQSYFPRSTSLAANLQSDDDAIQLGYWVLNKHRQPTQRIASITLDPAADPTPLWPVVLGLEVGQRVTVKRRPKAANGGAGITMSSDFFVENINHNQINMAAGTWRTTLLLSPATVTSTVFIFDDAVYGQFDGIGVFAY